MSLIPAMIIGLGMMILLWHEGIPRATTLITTVALGLVVYFSFIIMGTLFNIESLLKNKK